jgi:hypothetical protein
MEIYEKYLLETLPDGWTKDSVQKFAKTIAASTDKEGFFKK